MIGVYTTYSSNLLLRILYRTVCPAYYYVDEKNQLCAHLSDGHPGGVIYLVLLVSTLVS